MELEEIQNIKRQYNSPLEALAIKICERDPNFWSQSKEECVKEIEGWFTDIERRK